jgi:hypothetical protein
MAKRRKKRQPPPDSRALRKEKHRQIVIKITRKLYKGASSQDPKVYNSKELETAAKKLHQIAEELSSTQLTGGTGARIRR